MSQEHPGNAPETGPDKQTQPPADGSSGLRIESGVCHLFFAWDIGLSIDLDEADRRITDTKHRAILKPKRRSPMYFAYDPPPLRVIQTGQAMPLACFSTETTVEMMVYDFAAVSVTYRIPLHGAIGDLLALSAEIHDNPELVADSRRRVAELLTVIRPAVTKPGISELVEDYAIYQVEAIEPVGHVDEVLREHRPLLARILRGEVERLSDQEIDDALACRLSFTGDDLVVVDWNAALIFDRDADDVRSVLEFANVELLEMRYLDRQLDRGLEEAYETLNRRMWTMFGSRRKDLRRVAEMQVDSALLFEGVNNAIKLLGDQYLARLYRSASERLHLPEWDASILRKLHTLDSIYAKISDHHAHVQMQILEWIIIILIAVSIAVMFLPGGSGH